MQLLVKTAKALDRKFVRPIKGVIWVNEPASRCRARIQGRGQPADTKIRGSELYALEELHCKMLRTIPSDVEVAQFMDMTIHQAPGITKELVKWVECLSIEGSTSVRQRETFRYITITVSAETLLNKSC